ncbi:hypothetical protein ACHAWF_001668 [Thalassiosira exigua]
MSNISFYYPKRLQGMALGYNGGLGNLGVSVSQLLAPIVMNTSYDKAPIAPSGISCWPANAGWLWFPICAFSAILAFFFMSNQPVHRSKKNWVSLVCCKWTREHSVLPRSHCDLMLLVINAVGWMESMGFLASFIGVITLLGTRNSSMLSTSGGAVAHKFLLVLLAVFCEHLFMIISPKKARDRVKKQVVIFKHKHTYVMTWLYIMCFGSFIGYSGSFPKLIVDLFGYLTGDGCLAEDGKFTPSDDPSTCAGISTYVTGYEYPNPNAPNGASVAWLGAFVGSTIRPIGGMMADKYGGAKMTMIAIVWTTAAAFGQGSLVRVCREMDDPDKYYGLFIFLAFRTIGVLFPPEESGPVLCWSSAIASYGAFIIPVMFGIALKAGAYYVTCAVLNFWYYLRPDCEKPSI